MSRIFSGEPLPIPPESNDPEVNAYNRKVTDYLRRLSGKITQFLENPGGGGGSGALEAYAGYFTANQAIGAAYANVNWTVDLHKDAVYVHSTSVNPHKITVIDKGLYVVWVDFEVNGSPTFPVEADLTLTIGPNTGFVNYSFGSISARGTLSRAIALPLISDVSLAVRVKDAGGSGNNLLAQGSRLTIIRIRDDSGGGTGSPPGVGWTGTGTNLPGWATVVEE